MTGRATAGILWAAMAVGAAWAAHAQETPGYVAPRAAPLATTLPDWSGLWVDYGKNPNLFDPAALDRPENKGRAMMAMRDFPPYNAEWEAIYEKQLHRTTAGTPNDPDASCRPPSMPRIMTTPYPFEIVFERNRVDILLEISSQVRRIWTDGRPHTSAYDLDPTYNGESIGHWDGDTLVVDTAGLRGDTVYDFSAAPHSDQVHEVERIRRISPTLLRDEMTITDPVAFTKPWVVTRLYEQKPDWHILEYVCEDNNRNPPTAEGSPGFTPQGAPTK